MANDDSIRIDENFVTAKVLHNVRIFGMTYLTELNENEININTIETSQLTPIGYY